MKLAVVLILIFLLFGCNHDSQTVPVDDSSMSGTWRHTQEHEFYSTETDEYLYTDFIETSIIIDEGIEKVRYSECWEYGKNSYLAIKTDEHFYINNANTVFTLKDDGSYFTQTENNIQYPGMTTTYFNRHFTLEKISNDVIIDKGLLILSGPVEVTEYNQVCLWHQYSNLYDLRTYVLEVPYDDSRIGLRLNLMSTPEVGEVEIMPYNQDAAISGFGVSSSATKFSDIVGSNILSIDTASINIVESTDNILSGTYSFVANNNESYSGEFQMELKN